MKLSKTRCNKSVRQHFFSNRVVSTWNTLPELVVTAPTMNTFKNRLDKSWKEHKFTTNLHFPVTANQISIEDETEINDKEQLIGD